MSSEVNHRARKILAAVVREYLGTGDAVGSRTITKKHKLELSPATVRNVMSDLEELGLLTQIHTSSGRVPTQHGLRFFIDSLIKVNQLSRQDKENIRHSIGATPSLANDASLMLSNLTQHTGVVLAASSNWQRLKHIEFHKLSGDRILSILVTTDGNVQNRIIQNQPVESNVLEQVNNYLTEQLAGLTLAETQKHIQEELKSGRSHYDKVAKAALEIGAKAVADPSAQEVIVSGSANLVGSTNPDAEGLKQTKALLKALETKETVLDLLERVSSAQGIQVFLGAETELQAMKEASVIARPYGPDEQPLGAIAVVGPMRMNYGKIMSVVDFTASLMTEILADSES